MKNKYQVNQWIRFYQNCELVIGVINYVQFDSTFDSCPRYQTDKGEVKEDSVLEAR